MKKFSYQLETVLMHRKLLEEAVQLGFAAIARRLAMEREVLEAQVRQGEQLSTELAEKEKSNFDIQESLLYREYLAILEKEVQQTQERIRQLEIEFAKKREELLAATRKRKILDVHKGHEHTRYIQEADKEEQKGIDEISSIRHGRRKNESE